jgi:hypothetical protein
MIRKIHKEKQILRDQEDVELPFQEYFCNLAVNQIEVV